MSKNRRGTKKIKIEQLAAIVIALLCIAGVVWWVFSSDNSIDKEVQKQENTELQVVQFYLHLPERDYIVGRQSPKFKELVGLTQELMNGLTDSIKSPLAGSQGVQQSVYDIQRNNVSLSVWLPQSYQNQVMETDRILIILGGQYLGTVLTRTPNSEEWLAWETSTEQMGHFIELIRTGNL